MPSAPVRSSDPEATRTLDRTESELESRRESPAFRPLVQLRLALFRGGLVVQSFFLTLLVCLALILDFGIRALTRPRQPAQPVEPAEIDLRTVPSSSTLNFTSALSSVSVQTPTPQPETEVAVPDPRDKDVPNSEASRPVTLALAVSPEEPRGDLATVPPPVVLPDLAPPPSVSATVIEVPAYLRYPHRGDTPMMRTWNQLGLSALLAAAMAASPARAQIDGEPEKADAILKQLQTITKTLDQLKTVPNNLSELEKKLADAEKRLATSLSSLETVSQLQTQSLRNDLNALRDQYAQLKQEIDSLKKGMPGRQPTTALYPPAAGAAGRLRLVNTYLTPVSIVVNNRTYRLEPGEDRLTEAIPAGMFTYEVLAVQDRVSRQILPGETYLIHVHPR